MRRLLLLCHAPLALLAARGAAAESGAGPVPRPPPINVHYLHTGVGISGEVVAHPGDVCPKRAQAPCIFGSGVGVTIRAGYRSRGPWYVGGAYEVSRHDPSNLMRLAILQQLRGESRHYFDAGTRMTPFMAAGAGVALYGNEFGARTWGLAAMLAGGGEFQVSRSTVLGVTLAYRPFFLHAWTDSAGERRADHYGGFGFAHGVALEFTFETRKPLSRW